MRKRTERGKGIGMGGKKKENKEGRTWRRNVERNWEERRKT